MADERLVVGDPAPDFSLMATRGGRCRKSLWDSCWKANAASSSRRTYWISPAAEGTRCPSFGTHTTSFVVPGLK